MQRSRVVLPGLLLGALLCAACVDSGGGSGGGNKDGDAEATPQSTPSGEIRVLVYGDSLWDKGGDPGDCDLCELFPADVIVTNYAHAGAEVWPREDCDGFQGGVPVADDPGCRNGADRALRLQPDEDPANDFCGAEVDGQPTCLADQPPHDVVLLQFGTNDVRTDLDDAVWQMAFANYERWIEEILQAIPADTACVLVAPPPMWRPGYVTWNRRLAEVACSLTGAADRHGCTVADLVHTYLDIEAAQGEGATLPFYKDCTARATGSDCVHYSMPPPQVPADEILDAIDRALDPGA